MSDGATNWTPESGLRSTYPTVPWDEPLEVVVGEAEHIASSSAVIGDVRPLAYVCRYCVAIHDVSGLSVLQGNAGYGSYAEWEKHVQTTHGGHDAHTDDADQRALSLRFPVRTCGEVMSDEKMTRAERVAARFHEVYELLAPEHGYETRDASAVVWAKVPEPNKSLMIHVADFLLQERAIDTGPRCPGCGIALPAPSEQARDGERTVWTCMSCGRGAECMPGQWQRVEQPGEPQHPDPVREAAQRMVEACKGIAPFNGVEANSGFYRARDELANALADPPRNPHRRPYLTQEST